MSHRTRPKRHRLLLVTCTSPVGCRRLEHTGEQHAPSRVRNCEYDTDLQATCGRSVCDWGRGIGSGGGRSRHVFGHSGNRSLLYQLCTIRCRSAGARAGARAADCSICLSYGTVQCLSARWNFSARWNGGNSKSGSSRPDGACVSFNVLEFN